MSDIEMHYRFERYWEENASKETWANKTVAWNIWQEKQAEIDQLKAQLRNMEKCYIDIKKERDDLLAANTAMDRERNQYRNQATVYRQRLSQAGGLIAQYFKLRLDEPEMTIKAIQNSLIGHGEP